MKFILLGLDIKLVLEETLQDLANMLDMRLLVRREDQYIIQVDKNKVMQKVPKDVIYQCLENSWSVSQAKRHHQIRIMTAGGVKSSLPLIPLHDSDQMMSSIAQS